MKKGVDDGTAQIEGVAIEEIESVASTLRTALDTAPALVREILSNNQQREQNEQAQVATFNNDIASMADRLPEWVERVALEIDTPGRMGAMLVITLTDDSRTKLARESGLFISCLESTRA